MCQVLTRHKCPGLESQAIGPLPGRNKTSAENVKASKAEGANAKSRARQMQRIEALAILVPDIII
jgi:hypothetical protein